MTFNPRFDGGHTVTFEVDSFHSVTLGNLDLRVVAEFETPEPSVGIPGGFHASSAVVTDTDNENVILGLDVAELLHPADLGDLSFFALDDARYEAETIKFNL
jgi:hypothetical protein